MAVFAGARTQDLMGLSIRLAGFEIRDTLGWIYGSGMPKSHNIGKAIDKRPGVHHQREFSAHLKEKREAAGLSRQDVAEHVVGARTSACWNWEHHQFPKYEWWPALRDLLGLDGEKWGPIIAEADREVVGRAKGAQAESTGRYGAWGNDRGDGISEYNLTAPATSEAQRWDGWGTALKPAIEPIILARKPLDGTVANNVLAHGVGGLNIDACRVGTDVRPKQESTGGFVSSNGSMAGHNTTRRVVGEVVGRFPANVLLDEHAAKEMDKQSGTSVSRVRKHRDSHEAKESTAAYGDYGVAAYDRGTSDEGGASRFFPVFKYQAKAPKKERPVIEREDGSKIQHPTVKPLTLLEWLVELITPPGGVVLDPFAGSGTTLQAALNKGFQPIGIEQDADYIKLIEKRLEATCTTHKN